MPVIELAATPSGERGHGYARNLNAKCIGKYGRSPGDKCVFKDRDDPRGARIIIAPQSVLRIDGVMT